MTSVKRRKVDTTQCQRATYYGWEGIVKTERISDLPETRGSGKEVHVFLIPHLRTSLQSTRLAVVKANPLRIGARRFCLRQQFFDGARLVLYLSEPFGLRGFLRSPAVSWVPRYVVVLFSLTGRAHICRSTSAEEEMWTLNLNYSFQIAAGFCHVPRVIRFWKKESANWMHLFFF